MSFLVVEAYLKLVLFEFDLARGNFEAIYNRIRNCPVGKRVVTVSTGDVRSAVNAACVWYWKEVLCLQRSAVTACLLRQHGIAASFVIGAQHLPFRAHAWVEVDGHTIDGRSATQGIYTVLDRC